MQQFAYSLRILSLLLLTRFGFFEAIYDLYHFNTELIELSKYDYFIHEMSSALVAITS